MINNATGSFHIILAWVCITACLVILAMVFKKRLANYVRSLKNASKEEVRVSLDEDQHKMFGMQLSLIIVIAAKLAINLPFLLLVPLFIVCQKILPGVLLKRARNKAYKAFDEALVDALMSLSSSLKAGLTIQGAFEVAARSTPPIFSHQADQVISDYRLGVHIDEALERVRQRMPTDNCNMALGALIIGRQIGGPLPLILDRIATTIRERARVEGRLASLTAQGKGQAFLVCSLPVIIGLGTAMFSPDRFELMKTTLLGQVCLGLAATSELIGIFITMKMLKLDI